MFTVKRFVVLQVHMQEACVAKSIGVNKMFESYCKKCAIKMHIS